MKPFCIASVGIILAIFTGLYLNSIVLFLIICIIIGMIGIFTKAFLKQELKIFLIFAISFIAFFSYTIFLEKQYEQNCKQYGNSEVKIQGIVISKPEQKEYKDTYQIKVTQIENLNTQEKSFTKFKILCHIKKNKGDTSHLNYGDKIELIANYEIPSVARNEGGFDYKQYLKTKQIAGIITTNNYTKIAQNQANYMSTKLYQFKIKLIENIKSTLPKHTASVCIGLLLGDKSNILEEIKDNFRKSNLSHMLAISGAHVSYLLLGINTFFQKLKLHKRWSKIFVILFLIFFMALVDFTPSVTRACIMCILTLLADILFLKADVYQNLAISNFIILLINPYMVLDIGFQLSFGGTTGIIAFMGKIKISKTILEKERMQEQKQQNAKYTIIKNKLNAVKQIIKVSLAANLMVFPIMFYHFNTISLTFLISNLLATSIFGISLITGLVFIIFLIICKPLADFISYFLNFILQIFIQITNLASQIPFSQILLPTPKLWQIFIYYLLVYLLFNKSKIEKYFTKFLQFLNLKCKVNLKIDLNQIIKRTVKITYILLVFLLILPNFLKIFPANELKIHCIDVGQRR